MGGEIKSEQFEPKSLESRVLDLALFLHRTAVRDICQDRVEIVINV